MGQILTQRQLEHLLDVTPMTIFLWRKGEWLGEAKIENGDVSPLPCHVDASKKKNKVLFDSDEVLSWLEKHRPLLVEKFKEDHSGCNFCSKRRNSTSSVEGNSPPVPFLQQQTT